MPNIGINRQNVGRIAERIVSNELEYRGFRVSDLNKEGTSVNADLLAAVHGKSVQIQVKGSTYDQGYWFGYGHCETDHLTNPTKPIFNRASGFYHAEIIIMVCVRSPTDYQCLILPAEKAEQAAQINLDREFRTKTKSGSDRKPGKMWVAFDYEPRNIDAARKKLLDFELELLRPFQNNWEHTDLSLLSEQKADTYWEDFSSRRGTVSPELDLDF